MTREVPVRRLVSSQRTSENDFRTPREDRNFHHDYKLTGEILGVGMCGNVMTAEHRVTGKRVAVKTFKLAKLSRRAHLDLNGEIDALSSCSHPNITRLEAVYWSEDRVRLAVESCEGGDVFDHLHSIGRFSEGEASVVTKQVLTAVEYLHGKGLVHRDIKLENIVYESAMRNKVKLIDFGLCTHWTEGMAPLTRMCGTARYLAPEVVMRGKYTNKADLWCVGAATYTMITNQVIERDNEARPILSHNLGRCTRDAQDFVIALLVCDPAHRPGASEALRFKWIQDPNAVERRASPGAAVMKARPKPAMSRRSLHESVDNSRFSQDRLDYSRSAPSGRGGPRQPVTPPTTAPLSTTTARHAPRQSVWQRALSSVAFGRQRASALWASIRSRPNSTSRVRPEVELRLTPVVPE